MTIRRLLLLFLLALCGEVALFAVSYQDLLFLRQPQARLRAESAATFVRHAEAALSRSHVTRRHLEAIAAGARDHQTSDLETRALTRVSAAFPDDVGLRLRLADALRRAGQLERAEQVYRAILASTSAGTR